MKKISNLLMMALLTIGMGLTSCDEMLDNAVNGLKVKALKEGETTVTAKAGDKTAECTVTVKAAAEETIGVGEAISGSLVIIGSGT